MEPVSMQHLPQRPRRNRRSPALRAAFQETTISPANFILPLFVHEGSVMGYYIPPCCDISGVMGSCFLSTAHISSRDFARLWIEEIRNWRGHDALTHTVMVLSGEASSPIGAMPGCSRLGWRHGLIEEVLSCAARPPRIRQSWK